MMLQMILDEFKDLNRMEALHTFPVKRSTSNNTSKLEPDEFGNFLADIFKSDSVYQHGCIADFL